MGADISMPDTVPITRGQETMWDFARAFALDDPGLAGINVAGYRRVEGVLETDRLIAALTDVADRQEALRVRFSGVGEAPVMVVLDKADPLVRQFDWSSHPEPERTKRLGQLAFEERYRPFSALKGPLWSICVVRVAPIETVLIVSMSHLIADGWSVNIFFEDLFGAYEGRRDSGNRPAEAVMSMAAVAGYQRELMPGGPDVHGYWRERLSPVSGPAAFQISVKRSEVDLLADATVVLPLDQDLRDGLRGVARRARTTQFIALLACYQMVLHLRSGQSPIVVATATAGRNDALAARTIGQFANNLYVAIPIDQEMSLAEVVSACGAEMTAATRQMASFTQLLSAADPGSEVPRPCPAFRLYHGWFQAVTPSAPQIHHPELGIGPIAITKQRPPSAGQSWRSSADDQLELWQWRRAPSVTVSDARDRVVLGFNPEMYDRAEVQSVMSLYHRTIDRLVHDPDSTIRDLSGAGAGRITREVPHD